MGLSSGWTTLHQGLLKMTAKIMLALLNSLSQLSGCHINLARGGGGGG